MFYFVKKKKRIYVRQFFFKLSRFQRYFVLLINPQLKICQGVSGLKTFEVTGSKKQIIQIYTLFFIIKVKDLHKVVLIELIKTSQ